MKEEDVGEKDFVNEELHSNLGGFNIVKLEKEGKDIDTRLDEVREKDDISVGTHVYYVEGSDRPLVATGELFITFESGVSEDEQDGLLHVGFCRPIRYGSSSRRPCIQLRTKLFTKSDNSSTACIYSGS